MHKTRAVPGNEKRADDRAFLELKCYCSACRRHCGGCRLALADDAQQFAHRLLTSPGDKEERGIAGGTLADGEELPRVKEVVPLHLFGYVLAVAIDADCWFHGFPYAGKVDALSCKFTSYV